jgi:hypothetical protein
VYTEADKVAIPPSSLAFFTLLYQAYPVPAYWTKVHRRTRAESPATMGRSSIFIMGPQKSDQGGSAADLVLAQRLRRVRFVAVMFALPWIAAAIACTWWFSGRLISDRLAEAATDADRDTQAIAQVVDRMFSELTAIPQVLSNNRELQGARASRVAG